MSQQQSFSYVGTGLPGLNQYLARIYVLALGPVTPVRLEPATPRSRVKHCTTEPLHPRLKNRLIAYVKTKVQNSCVVTAKLIRLFVCNFDGTICLLFKSKISKF